jgi:DNA-directed RNA polymerase specialized sigma24 family protein
MNQDIVIERVAAKSARKWKRRVFWADPADLKQEALMACYEAIKTYDPTTAIPLGAYLWQACAWHLRKWCWQQSAPVCAPHHKLHELKGIHREPVRPEEVFITRGPYEDLHEKQGTRAVREQVSFVLGDMPSGKLEARLVINLKWSPSEVAAALNVPVKQVYQDTKRGRRALADNRMLYDLYKESEE